jgi:MFS family permease
MALSVMSMSFGGTARIMGYLGPKVTTIVGLILAGGGLSIFATSGLHTAYFPTLFVAFVLIGLGGATVFTPLLTIAIAGVPHHDAGLGSGIVNVAQQVSAAFAVAVLATVASSRTTALLAQGHSPASALDGGYSLAYLVALACVVAAIGLSFALLRSPARAADQDPAHLLAAESPEDLEVPV